MSSNFPKEISIQSEDDLGHFSSELRNRPEEDVQARRKQIDRLYQVEPEVRRHAILNLLAFLTAMCVPADHESAVQYARLVLKENPCNLNALKNLAALLSSSGSSSAKQLQSGSESEISELRVRYQEAKKLNKHRAEAYIELAIAYNLFDQHKKSDCDKAIELFRRGIELGSGVVEEKIQVLDWRFSFAFHVWRLYHSLVSQNLGRTGEAEEYFNLAEDQFSIIVSQSKDQISDKSRLNMLQGRAWTMLGVLLFKGKGRELRSYQKIDYRECFERAKKIRDPDSDSFMKERFAFCCKSLTEAVNDYTTIIAKNGTWQDFERRGKARFNIYLFQKDRSEKKQLRMAIKDLKQANRMNPTSHYVCTQIALALLQLAGEDGDGEQLAMDHVWEAAKYADKAEKCLGTQIDVNVYRTKAEIFRRLGLEEAERYKQLTDIYENVEPTGPPLVDADLSRPCAYVAAGAGPPAEPFTRPRYCQRSTSIEHAHVLSTEEHNTA